MLLKDLLLLGGNVCYGVEYKRLLRPNPACPKWHLDLGARRLLFSDLLRI